MSNDYEEPSIDQRFRDKNNCYRALAEARLVFAAGSTEEQYQQVHKTLAIMRFYCPAEVEPAVGATQDELEWRYGIVFGRAFEPSEDAL